MRFHGDICVIVAAMLPLLGAVQGWGRPAEEDEDDGESIPKSIARDGPPPSVQVNPEDILPLNFNLNGRHVEVTLIKDRKLSTQLPVYVAGDDGVIVELESEVNETFSVYTDQRTMAAFVVREHTTSDGNLERQMRGTFGVDGDSFSIEPLPDALTPGRAGRHAARDTPREEDGDGEAEEEEGLEEVLTTVTMEGVDYKVSTINRERLNDMLHDAVSRDDIEMINQQQNDILSLGLDYNYGYPGKIPYEVEVFLVADYSIYRHWLELSRNSESDAINNIRFYFIHILNGINLRYRQIQEQDFEIFLDPVGIYIAKTPGASAFTEYPPIKQGTRYTEAYDALDAFEEWINVKVKELPPFDQATLFTKNYLFSGLRSDGSRRRINGLADIKGVCRYRRASIAYDSGQFGGVQTAAHEMGHNLGAYHDGYDNECVSRDQFIMATSPGALTDTTRTNPFRFSHCSIRAFRDYLFYIRMNKTNCLLTNSNTNGIQDFDQHLDTLPGQRYNADAQCKQMFGPSSYYCGGGRYDSLICEQMHCWDSALRRCLHGAEQRAAEGTTCGSSKWCMEGVCIHDDRAPATPVDTCIYGDYKGIVDQQSKWSCQDLGRYAPWRCYDVNLQADCCDTCGRLRQTGTSAGCEFGDADPDYCRTINPLDCYDVNSRQRCCQTCARHSDPSLSGCEYGDRASWCRTVEASRCYLEEDICCKTCAQHKRGREGCEFGDQVSWCNSDIQRRDCYESRYQDQCCDTCDRFKTGPAGCEWGDRDTTCSSNDCTDANRRLRCCATCANVNVAPPSGGTDHDAGSQPCPAGDEADWCSYRTASECYTQSTTCCQSCSRFSTGLQGCEYGNKVSWCDSYIGREGASVCQRDTTVASQCCLTCSKVKESPSGPVEEPDCADMASWCSSMNSGQCYDTTTRNTCCATCHKFQTGRQDCLYGDRYTWCTKGNYCSTNAADCCVTC